MDKSNGSECLAIPNLPSFSCRRLWQHPGQCIRYSFPNQQQHTQHTKVSTHGLALPMHSEQQLFSLFSGASEFFGWIVEVNTQMPCSLYFYKIWCTMVYHIQFPQIGTVSSVKCQGSSVLGSQTSHSWHVDFRFRLISTDWKMENLKSAKSRLVWE